MTNNQLDRFLAKVYLAPNGCWEWTAYRNPYGYGRLGTSMAHRLSYEHFAGEIPSGFEIDHLCRVRGCVNPTHMEAVTHAVNVRRGAAGALISDDLRQRKSVFAKESNLIRHVAASRNRKRTPRTHCPQGHPYDEKNTHVGIGRNGWTRRDCRACSAAYQAAKRAARRNSEQAA